MRIAVVTGNPKPASRTHGVALAVADALAAASEPENHRVGRGAHRLAVSIDRGDDRDPGGEVPHRVPELRSRYPSPG